MNIQIAIKSVYGKDLRYPVGKTAHLLAKLTGTKTFTKAHIVFIEELGYTIEYIPYCDIIDSKAI